MFMSQPVKKLPPSDSIASPYRRSSPARSSPSSSLGTASTALPPPNGNPATANFSVIPAASRVP